MTETGKTLHTLGTSRRSWEDFIEILLSFGIGLIADVRSFPKSKLEHFSRETLEKNLAANGIDYRWLGRELGGLRKGGYEAHTQTELFREGIDALEAMAGEKPAAIICAERFPWKCHRRWIARELHRRGWRVVHIIDKGHTWTPGETREKG